MDDSDFTPLTLEKGEVIKCSACSTFIKAPDEAFLIVDDHDVTGRFCRKCLCEAEGIEYEED